MCRRILQLHKIMSDMSPFYLKERLPPNRRPFLYSVFREIKCRTNRYTNSYFPDAIASWNIIITHFEDFPSIISLKKHIVSLIRPETKIIFGLHDPIGLRYLFQLRVSLSPLRSHKRRHNFDDTPSEKCHCNQGTEDTCHFLFSCPSYAFQRSALLTSVDDILQKNNLNHLGNQLQLYLYGHRSINYTDNRKILLSTIKYIKDTRRFLT